MISVVCFKWQRNQSGFQLPCVCDYGYNHVNILYNMVKRNLTIPFRFICVTDNWQGLDENIEVVELWDKCRELGGCYNRLFVFDPIMKHYLGDKFVCIDLDCVITGNLDRLFTLQDDFIINDYPIEKYKHATHQYYNGGLFMMTAGSRAKVWNRFNENPQEIISQINARNEGKEKPELVGSDQAVITHILGKGEKVFNEEMGIYDFMLLPDKNQPPENAKIILFAGQRDPSQLRNRYKWIKDLWQ